MGSRSGNNLRDPNQLDRLIQEITVDAYGDDEKLWAFRQALEDEITVPCDGYIIGEPVCILGFDYDGNERRGLTARCRRQDGSEHVVAASEVALPAHSRAARHLAAYRKWLGLDPFPLEADVPSLHRRQHKAVAGDLDLSRPVELVVLSVKEKAARCRLLGSERVITLRAGRLWELVPGEIAVVRPRRQWRYAAHPYLSGEIESVRREVDALDLVPLRLDDRGLWRPEEHYWGEAGEPIQEWARPIVARGPRPMFEMEQVMPGTDPEDFDFDPIEEANELYDAGDAAAARKILMELCQADLCCLDAHAHLGSFAFDYSAEDAIRHFQVGVEIGQLSLPAGFDGVLLWDHVNNRPFLRCLKGYGLCLWRMNRFQEAERVFERMLWLNPADNQGARFLVEEVRAGRAWTA